MDIEQLKLILETIQSTTGDAKHVLIMFLSYSGLKMLIGYVLTGLGIWFSYKCVRSLLNNFKEYMFACSLRGMVCPGLNHGDLTTSEKDKIINAVRLGMKVIANDPTKKV